MELAVIDYGMGNLRSVFNAFNAVGCNADIISYPENLKNANRIVLPGVGSFGIAMKKLRENGWVQALEEEVRGNGKPFLGICLGMQLLATTGTEHGINEGLNWIPGVVNCLSSNHPEFRLPHIGWNNVSFNNKKGLFDNMADAQDFYFVNSFAFYPDDTNVISGTCEYFVDFVASVEKDNIYATQFHPEKSHKAGLAVLANFLKAKAV